MLDYFITQNLVDADIEIRGDSILVIDQMAGRSKIGSGIYASAAWKARELADRFANIKFCWIPRTENDLADELSKSELIDAGIQITERQRSA